MSFNSGSASMSVSGIATGEIREVNSSEVVVAGQSSDVVVCISSDVVPEYSVRWPNRDIFGFLFLVGYSGTIRRRL